MPAPKIEFVIDVAQFRNAMGQWTGYSEELRRTRLQPWAEMLASGMSVIASEHIPSETVYSMLRSKYEYIPGPGGGTRITMTLPKEWNRLAIWLLEGVAPHPIWPTAKRGLWWEASAQGYEGSKTRGAPNRSPKIIYQPERPLRYVIHPGFKGYDYISKIEEDTLTDEVLGPGGIATKIGREAEIALTPKGEEAFARGARRRVRGAKSVRRLFPHRFRRRG